MANFQSTLSGSLIFQGGSGTNPQITPGLNKLGITGSLEITGSSLILNGRDINARLESLEAGGGGDAAIGRLTLITGGLLAHTASVNLFTASIDTRVSGLEASSASISALNAVTASFITGASATLNTITFTKQDGTTIVTTINTGSGGGVSSYADLTNVPAGILSSSAQVQTLGFVTSSVSSTGSLLTTASIAGQILTFTKGDASTFNVTIPSASVAETATVTDTFTNVTTHDVSHNFNTRNIIVSVYDTAYNQLIPLTVNVSNLNTVRVTFSSATSGHVVVAKGGHIVSGSSSSETYKAVLNGSNTYAVTHNLAEDYPLVQVYDSSRAQVIPSSVVSNNNNRITISFSANFNGNVIVKK